MHHLLMPFQVTFYSHWATLKGKNVLLIGSTFFPLTVAPFKAFSMWKQLDYTIEKMIQIPSY